MEWLMKFPTNAKLGPQWCTVNAEILCWLVHIGSGEALVRGTDQLEAVANEISYKRILNLVDTTLTIQKDRCSKLTSAPATSA
jgi:hypothetical protein